MAGELHFIATSNGLTVEADLYKDGSFVRSVFLPGKGGGPSSTIYEADMPSGLAKGKYTAVYRVVGDASIHGPDIIWWSGSTEVSLVDIQEKLTSILGDGFEPSSDSLESLSNAIAGIDGSGGSGDGGSGSFTSDDRSALARIEIFSKDAAAGAVGDFFINEADSSGTLRHKDGSEAATFSMRDKSGQPSIDNAVQRSRL